ncbi:MAG: chorismate mutase [Lachnospiraceae bacterium]|nr:chorismate mutase [Lachnospiraceae bacterium]
MTLDEIRTQIDQIDSQIIELFVKRMECSKHVAEAKAVTGGDVFVLERELAIIKNRASDVDPVIYDEYVAFLRHLMSVSRRYQYGILTDMQERVLSDSLKAAGLNADLPHSEVTITFSCDCSASDLNLYINMIKLNNVSIKSMSLETKDEKQMITMTLIGKITDANMKQLLCQIGKESTDFGIVALR